MYSQERDLISNTTQFYILINIKNGTPDVKYISLDTAYNINFKRITKEISGQKVIISLKNYSFFVPVFFIDLDNQTINLNKENVNNFMNSFPTQSMETKLIRKIVLYSYSKRNKQD